MRSPISCLILLTAVVVLLVVAAAQILRHQPVRFTQDETIDLKGLPAIGRPFKVAPYLRAAALLQAMGKEKACEQLARLAKDKAEDGQVVVLCRMLFCPKPGVKFRMPLLGAPACLGGTSHGDWPLLPIALIDDVPFNIVWGYLIAGYPEPSESYLKFCLENCEWSKVRFHKIDKDAIEKALQKLLKPGYWRKPLTEHEREYLSSQIE